MIDERRRRSIHFLFSAAVSALAFFGVFGPRDLVAVGWFGVLVVVIAWSVFVFKERKRIRRNTKAN